MDAQLEYDNLGRPLPLFKRVGTADSSSLEVNGFNGT
jgi:hypothetical protein